jgi:hypothetical protein
MIPRILTSILATFTLALSVSAAPSRSPLNQVFQFAFTGNCTAWPDGSTTKSTGYLWIPENCKKVRGLVILCTNVPEHVLVGHSAIRSACEKNDLALAWFVPTFWNFSKFQSLKEAAEKAGAQAQEDLSNNLRQTNVDFLQQMLDGLAAASGYDEIASVPWLPVGESAHLLMVCGLLDEKPARCIAGICVKNPQYPKDRSVPLLWTLGTGQEWAQIGRDFRTAWKDQAEGAKGWGKGRAETGWPLSAAVEAGTGHFYCSDEMAELIGKYISEAAKVRLSDDGSPTLKSVDLKAGVLANLPLPSVEDLTIIPYASAKPEELKRPWYFTAELAKMAQDITRANWNAETQVPGFVADTNCEVKPFSFNSVTEIAVTTDSEFTVKSVLLESIPDGFVGAGENLATTPGAPLVEWACGPIAPAGDGKFKIALDRTWKTGAACYIVARKDAAASARRSVQPAMVKLMENKDGAPQVLTFDKIPDVPAGTKSVPLSAKSDSGLPVEFTVISGPATIEGNNLVFTPIPPRAKYPVEVTVGAWQWGRSIEPKIKTADMVRQTMRITKEAK